MILLIIILALLYIFSRKKCNCENSQSVGNIIFTILIILVIIYILGNLFHLPFIFEPRFNLFRIFNCF